MSSPQQQISRENVTIPVETAASKTEGTAACKLTARNINFFYGAFQALHGISLDIPSHRITAFIGPSGRGKSQHFSYYEPHERSPAEHKG